MANCQSKVRLHALTQDLQTRFGVDKERRVHAISHRLSETVQVLRVSCILNVFVFVSLDARISQLP